MHDFLKFHHNCDVYMGVQKELKSTFLTAFEHREKRLAAYLLHNIFIAIVSCCTIFYRQVFVIWELSIQYRSQIFVLVNRF